MHLLGKPLNYTCLFDMFCSEDEKIRTNRPEVELNFYYCKICGKIIAVMKDSGTPTYCCGQEMELLLPETTDTGSEKHVPVIKVHDTMVTVFVGEVDHPMTNVHYIQWVNLLTSRGLQTRFLFPGEKPVAKFLICPTEKILGAWAFCNLHKLWKSQKVEEI